MDVRFWHLADIGCALRQWFLSRYDPLALALGPDMRRREFITLLGGAVVTWPVAARAQQQTMPVLGYLGGGSRNKPYVAAFHQGLNEGGFVEGQSVAILYHWAEGHFDQ